MFQVSHQGKSIADADSIEGAREIVRSQPLGRYDVDEISSEPLSSVYPSRRSGVRIRLAG
jgi:hypothetical protein